ncbi:RagB/SusD family nutrient uptake outer membrane protein [Sphingobacterium sp.]|uniref:RagB/SusD family nutrient uptake outer membrane protein n=1 Tax=Sphingobacterium sp. TaxID=341027 RepID=UPI00289C99F9|nr:RagB/SusD family nutrient uptake outer membrane protein [Sphingobacterium sp.]
MKKIIQLIPILLIMYGCNGFLDIKPDKKMSIPQTLEDCELLLNDYTALNSSYPVLGAIAAEEFYLTSADWNSIGDQDDRNAYIWSDEPSLKASAWQSSYKVVYIANQVLQVLDALDDTQKQSGRFKTVMGNAYFFRAFAFQQLMEIYAIPYDKATAETELGIPIRLSPDLDVISPRATLKQSYDRVLEDFKKAASLLSGTSIAKSLPTAAAANAALSRLYLTMGDYQNAYTYADLAWKASPQLLDYNTLNVQEDYPIARFNKEVLFSALTQYSDAIGNYYARISPELLDTYESNDLRKQVFFRPSDADPSAFAFKGSYDQGPGGVFVGLTSSEVILNKAESACRLGQMSTALADLNTLRKSRWKSASYQSISETDPDRLLDFILQERRRELVFRGRRWSDVKRLGSEPLLALQLKRTVDQKVYILEANSLKYAFLIPQLVINQNNNIQQNKR